jgi:hypothetical protein
MKNSLYAVCALCLLIALTSVSLFTRPALGLQAGDSERPDQVVKLIFIHHSTGENWLTDGYGDLGRTLGENNYFVSDTNYGWGPEAIGDRTDIPNWTEWFASENTPIFMEALFTENGQNSSYTRTLSDPGGENQIIMFKSCFPNSALEGNPDDPPGEYEELTVSGAKYVYNRILEYFASRPDKLFVLVTAPPLSDPTYAENARAFNQWLFNDWLRENNYPYNNVVVFDFYNILTGSEAHHRFNGGQVEHIVGGRDTLYYPSGDDHPSIEGSRKATEEFVPMLNYFYSRWKAGGSSELPPQTVAPPDEAATQPSLALPPSGTSGLIDDFEGGPLTGTAGWEAYFQDNANTELTCVIDTSLAHGGSSSLRFEFDVDANSWATCGIYFNITQNWSAGQGISFYFHADRTGLPFDVELFGGSPGGRTTYLHGMETSSDTVNGWMPVQIRWEEILRAEWEENAGKPFNPAEVTGFNLGLSAPEQTRLSGTLWLDDLQVLGGGEGSAAVGEGSADSGQTSPSERPQTPMWPCGGALILPLLMGVMLFRKNVKH